MPTQIELHKAKEEQQLIKEVQEHLTKRHKYALQTRQTKDHRATIRERPRRQCEEYCAPKDKEGCPFKRPRHELNAPQIKYKCGLGKAIRGRPSWLKANCPGDQRAPKQNQSRQQRGGQRPGALLRRAFRRRRRVRTGNPEAPD